MPSFAMKTTVLLALLLATATQAADWPHWRGPNRNGISEETIGTNFPGDGPKVLWKANVGIGFTSFSVADGKVFTMGWADDKDTVFAFDAKSGKQLWAHSYDSELGDKYYEGGPGSTPTVDGANVFTLGKWGDVCCLDSATGKVAWEKNVAKELKVDAPTWGFAGSPVVSGKQLFLNIGTSACSLDKATGKVLWSSDGKTESGYSTPLQVKLNGQDILFTANTKAYLALDPATGKQLWDIPWVTRYGINAADPIVHGSNFFISTGYGKGCAMYELKAGESKLLWQHRDLRTQMNAAVLIDGHLYGIDGDENQKTMLKCLDVATGTTKWSEPIAKMGSVVAAKNALIVLSGKGELTLAKISPAGYESITTAQILSGKCWSVPVLANGILYCRNAAGDVVALDVK
jgi:outer membrane protein assembly factor BamB